MKKTYIEPANIVVRISTERMIAESGIKGVSGPDGLGVSNNSTSGYVTTSDSREALDEFEEW